EMIRAAEAKGLSGIAITDHNNMEGAIEAESIETDIVIIKGCEISSLDGHILAYGIEDRIERGLSAADTIDMIKEQGGIAVAAHPFDRRRCAVGDRIFQLPFDAIEALNGHYLNDKGRTMKVCEERSLNVTAGSDAHMAKEVGSCYTLFEDLNDLKKEIKEGRTGIGGHATSVFTLGEKWIRTNVLRQGRFDQP
nr:PHP-associated domain-containing protein [Candidatus Methanofastidiosa archaeon]